MIIEKKILKESCKILYKSFEQFASINDIVNQYNSLIDSSAFFKNYSKVDNEKLTQYFLNCDFDTGENYIQVYPEDDVTLVSNEAYKQLPEGTTVYTKDNLVFSEDGFNMACNYEDVLKNI